MILPTRMTHELLFSVVVLSSFVTYWLLLGGFFDHVYEPDTDFSLIVQYITAIENFNIKALPVPSGHYPYFDGGSILYAIFAMLLQALGVWSEFSTKESIYIFSVYAVNIALYSIGVGIFYRICHRLSGSLLLSCVLAMMFAISPMILDINPLRIDYVIYSLTIFVCYLCILILQGVISKSVVYSLGVTSAFLVTTKVTGVTFLLLPFLCFMLSWRENYLPLIVRGFLASFLSMFMVLMVRYLYHGILVHTFIGGIQEVRRWSDILPMEPYWFYNIDNFTAYGKVFLFIAIASICIVSFYALFKQDRISIFILVPLVCFSLLLMLSPKFSRWGTVISIYYFLTIAVALAYTYKFFNRFTPRFVNDKLALLAICILLLPSGLAFSEKYRAVYKATEHKAAAIKSTKTMPMDWFRKNATKDSVVCIFIHSDWVIPPLAEVGMRVIYGPFNFPYLDPVLMGTFQPPDVENLSRECEYVLIDGFHLTVMLGTFTKYGHKGVEKAWMDFLGTGMKTHYEHLSFTTEYPEWSWWNLDLYVRKAG